MSIERARRLVRQYTAAKTAEEAEPIAQRMVAHGECVWHAAAVVSGQPCWCSDCKSAAREHTWPGAKVAG